MHNGLLSVVAALAMAAFSYAHIHVTVRPQSLYDVDDTLGVAWTGTADPCTLRYGERIGTYDNTVSRTGTDSLWFVPQDEGMGPGVHRWVISDGTDSSLVYDLFIQTDQSGMPGNANINPAAGETLRSVAELMPSFRWEAKTPQIPYYHVVLLDEPIHMHWGSSELHGVSVIWQAIIPGTEIQFMTPDPSGAFDGTTPPPLLNGKTYYWIVFNNLGGIPALTSSRLGNPFSFIVDAPLLDIGLTAPDIYAPADSSTEWGGITFIWSPVTGAPGAVAYTVYLYETGFFATGDTCMYLKWSQTVADTAGFRLDNSDLKGGWYKWIVVGETGGQRIASAPHHFYFNQTVRQVVITVTDTAGIPLPRVTIAGPDSLPLFTDENGRAMTAYYSELGSDPVTLRFEKDTYHDMDTVIVLSDGTSALPVSVTMTPKSSVFYGRVQDADYGTDLRSVTVTALGDAADECTAADQYGCYRIYADSGSWYFFYQKEGYETQSLLNRTIGHDEVVRLPDIHLQESSGTVNITVEDYIRGYPVASAMIYAFRLAGGDTTARMTGFTNTSGQYSFTAQQGYWRIYATKVGYTANYTSCTVQADSTENRTIALEPLPGMITGMVRYDTDPLSGAVITYTVIGSYMTDSVITGAGGLYSIDAPVGTYQLTVSLDGYATAMDTVDVGPGETKTVYFNLAPVVGMWPGPEQDKGGVAPIMGIFNVLGEPVTQKSGSGIILIIDMDGRVYKKIAILKY